MEHFLSTQRSQGLLGSKLLFLAMALLFGNSLFAFKSTIGYMRDLSTVVQCGKKFYCFGTGGGAPMYVSDDMVNWKSDGSVFGTQPSWIKTYAPNFSGNFWAPDVVFMNNKYYVYYSCYNEGGEANLAAIGVATNPTLDRSSPDFKWTDQGMVVWSNNSTQKTYITIDAGIFIDTDKKPYMVYGTYAGKLGVVELDAASGKVKSGATTTTISYKAEGGQMMKYGDYYWLFVNHGSCCEGVTSSYAISCGRSKSIKGPFLDQNGGDMTGSSYGTTVIAKKSKTGKYIGPGHFGSITVNGIEFISFHYVDAAGGSTKLGFGKMVWTNGWPTVSMDWIPNGSNYYITNTGSGKNWWVSSGNSGTGIFQETPNNTAAQKWTFTSLGDGLYSVTTTQSGGRVAEVAGCSAAKGAMMQLASGTSSTCGKFFIERAADGSYVMTPIANGDYVNTQTNTARVIETPNSSGGSTQLALNDYNSASKYQKWTVGTSVLTGVEDEDFALLSEGINCFPNPFTNELKISATGESFDYAIYDMAGNPVEQGHGQNTTHVGDALPAGLFVVRVRSSSGNKAFKVAKN